MEAPQPSYMTPKPETDLEGENTSQKTTTLLIKDNLQNDNIFNILYNSNKIIFQIREKDDSTLEYKKEANINDFQNAHRFFFQFNSTKEIFEDFLLDMDETNFEIKKENDKKSLTIKFLVVKKFNEINFELSQQKIKIDDIVSSLCDKIKEIDELKNQIKEMKNDFNEKLTEIENKFNRKILELESKIQKGNFANEDKEANKEINENENNNGDNNAINQNNPNKNYSFNFSIDSLTLKKENLGIIQSGITKQLNKEITGLKLIFRASRDGDSSKAFHSICDDHCNTLSVIRTTNNKTFGGFTTKDWSPNSRPENDWKYDDKSFLFSIDNNKCYFINNPSYAIRCDRTDLCSFGEGTDIRIISGCTKNVDSYEAKNGSFISKYENDYVFTGREYFKVKELEVYEVIMK